MKLSQPPPQKPESSAPVNPTTAAAKKSLGRKAGGALFWNVVFLPIKTGLGLIVSLVIVKLFLRDAYATLAIITSLLALLGLYTDLGIERALPRFVSEIERTKGREALRRFIFNVTIIKLAILAVVICIFAAIPDAIIKLFEINRNGQGRIYLTLICTLLVLGALYDIATQVLYSFFKQKVTNLLDIVVTVLNPALTLIFIVFFNMDVYGVILGLLLTTIASVIIAAWQAWLASKEADEKPSVAVAPPAPAAQPEVPGSPEAALQEQLEDALLQTVPTKTTTNAADSGTVINPARKISVWKRFAQYAALMYFFNISVSFYDAPFVVLVLTFYREFTAVLIIRLVYSFIKTLLKSLLTPFNGVQTPLFASIQAEDRPDKLRSAYSSLSKLQIFILVPSALGVIILARNLLELLMLRQSGDAVLTPDLLPLATWATILTILFTFTEALISLPMVVLMIYEKYRFVIISRLLPLLTGPLLLMAVFLGWGAIGAIIMMGLMAVGSRVVAMVALQRTLGLFYPVKFFWKVFKASAAFGIPLMAVIWLLPVNWFVTVGVAVVGVIIFVGAFKLLGGFDQEDKNRLLTLRLPGRQYIVKYL